MRVVCSSFTVILFISLLFSICIIMYSVICSLDWTLAEGLVVTSNSSHTDVGAGYIPGRANMLLRSSIAGVAFAVEKRR